MLRKFYLAPLLWASVISPCAAGLPSDLTQMVVPNVRESEPACKIQLVKAGEECGDGQCTFSRIDWRVEPAKVTFSCIRAIDNTGFEHPAPEMKVMKVRYRSGTGLLGIMDDSPVPGAPGTRAIMFCLLGQNTYLCGSTHVRKVKGQQARGIRQSQALIKRLDFTEVGATNSP